MPANNLLLVWVHAESQPGWKWLPCATVAPAC